MLGLGVAAATVLAGCTGDTGSNGGSTNGEGSTVPYGASAAEYQAALADMEPVELVMQSTAAAAELPQNEAFLEFVGFIEEYSGGKITFDVTYANGIVSNILEWDDGLLDGRLDIAFFYPQYDPAEYPVNNLYADVGVLRDPRAITGFYAAEIWMQEVGLGTPEVVAEYIDRGILPLQILSPDGPMIMFCTEPVTTLADMQGKQIRASSPTLARQINELGGVGVSMPYPEVYEALQRGILDCLVGSHALAVTTGTLEVAPYITHSASVSWAPAHTNMYAGPRVMQLPAVAQQLILEAGQFYQAHQFSYTIEQIGTELLDGMNAAGGEWLTLDPEVEERLAEINDEILADVEATNLFDGVEMVERARALSQSWLDRVTELGYVDGGPISEFPTWFQTGQPYDHETWFNAVVTEMLAENSPI